MARLNCWEDLKCGRKADGNKIAELGVCPAAIETSCNGINNGKSGGRICWAIAGTFCSGKVDGIFAKEVISCMACEFFKRVKAEEADKFTLLRKGQTYNPST